MSKGWQGIPKSPSPFPWLWLLVVCLVASGFLAFYHDMPGSGLVCFLVSAGVIIIARSDRKIP